MLNWRTGSRCLIVLLAASALICGCRSEGAEPPPTSLGEGAPGLAPVSLQLASMDKNLVGAIAPDEAPVTAQPGAPAEGGAVPAGATVPIDQSTPEAAANSLVLLMNAAALSQLPSLVVPDQQQVAGEFASAVQPLAGAMVRFRSTMDQRFAGHGTQMTTDMPGGMDLSRAWQLVRYEMDPIDPASATATIIGGDGQEKVYPLKQVDNLWYVEMPDAPPPGAMSTFAPMAQQLVAAIQSVQARLDAGEFTDAQSASQALSDAMANPAAFVPADGGLPAEGAPPASPFPPQNPGGGNSGGGVVPDVDSTVGPGFLNRG